MNDIAKIDDIQNSIYTIQGKQVMLDKDLAVLYNTETRTLKQAVKRNANRFPDDFMFKLTDDDINTLVSQSVIPSKSYFGGAVPYAFTEQGISMLSAVLRTDVAVEISINIIRAFAEMRKFIATNATILSRLSKLEQKQITSDLKQSETDNKINKILNALETNQLTPKQNIFYNGQIFDAYLLISDMIKSAKKSIVLIDNYVDETVLAMLDKRNKNCTATIYTKKITKQLKLDIEKHNQQYPKIELKKLTTAHDRFLIIDSKTVYHFGASLKDTGKKWFAFSKLEIDANDILEKLKREN
jgi:hypothetical protein